MNNEQKEVIRQLSLKYGQSKSECEEMFKTLRRSKK